ncbi:mediator complex [Planoprotostelium fungivorum]|uniref:Mediator complex n=1 Tax=Planoprotostelium fungivorum TaxID=1890364 RepID=A0A2P6NGQ4_9EUKA|nr:mediator complex [Planoprotostelium fungivorum]
MLTSASQGGDDLYLPPVKPQRKQTAWKNLLSEHGMYDVWESLTEKEVPSTFLSYIQDLPGNLQDIINHAQQPPKYTGFEGDDEETRQFMNVSLKQLIDQPLPESVLIQKISEDVLSDVFALQAGAMPKARKEKKHRKRHRDSNDPNKKTKKHKKEKKDKKSKKEKKHRSSSGALVPVNTVHLISKPISLFVWVGVGQICQRRNGVPEFSVNRLDRHLHQWQTNIGWHTRPCTRCKAKGINCQPTERRKRQSKKARKDDPSSVLPAVSTPEANINTTHLLWQPPQRPNESSIQSLNPFNLPGLQDLASAVQALAMLTNNGVSFSSPPATSPGFTPQESPLQRQDAQTPSPGSPNTNHSAKISHLIHESERREPMGSSEQWKQRVMVTLKELGFDTARANAVNTYQKRITELEQFVTPEQREQMNADFNIALKAFEGGAELNLFPVLVTGRYGVIYYANPAFRKLTGWEGEVTASSTFYPPKTSTPVEYNGYLKLFAEEEQAERWKTVTDLFKGPHTAITEKTILKNFRSDGKQLDVLLQTTIWRNVFGLPVILNTQAIPIDIVEQVLSGKQLKETL